jgi:hypothetical protein
MRLPAVAQPIQPPRQAKAAQYLRRFLPAPSLPRTDPEPVRLQELPADLDQRVRLVGEW